MCAINKRRIMMIINSARSPKEKEKAKPKRRLRVRPNQRLRERAVAKDTRHPIRMSFRDTATIAENGAIA